LRRTCVHRAAGVALPPDNKPSADLMMPPYLNARSTSRASRCDGAWENRLGCIIGILKHRGTIAVRGRAALRARRGGGFPGLDCDCLAFTSSQQKYADRAVNHQPCMQRADQNPRFRRKPQPRYGGEKDNPEAAENAGGRGIRNKGTVRLGWGCGGGGPRGADRGLRRREAGLLRRTNHIYVEDEGAETPRWIAKCFWTSGFSKEAGMKQTNSYGLLAGVRPGRCNGFGVPGPWRLRKPPSQDRRLPARRAAARRGGWPAAGGPAVEAYAVVPGNAVSGALDDAPGTPRNARKAADSKYTTLEPLEGGNGIYRPPGAGLTGT